jgi:hypothetical protein
MKHYEEDAGGFYTLHYYLIDGVYYTERDNYGKQPMPEQVAINLGIAAKFELLPEQTK